MESFNLLGIVEQTKGSRFSPA